MGAGGSQKQINRKLAHLKKKNPGQEYVVQRASNGEVAILTKEWVGQCRRKYSEERRVPL